MPLDPDTLAKLTTKLASDTELYNKVIGEVQQADETIAAKEKEIETTTTKLQEAEQRGIHYVDQINNLLSRIPVGPAVTTAPSMEQKVEEVKNRGWVK